MAISLDHTYLHHTTLPPSPHPGLTPAWRSKSKSDQYGVCFGHMGSGSRGRRLVAVLFSLLNGTPLKSLRGLSCGNQLQGVDNAKV